MKTTYFALFRIISHYFALFRIISHYFALFRIILVVLTVIPAFSSNGQTNPDDSSNSDALTMSLYSGIGDVNFGGSIETGIGLEYMLRNVSFNLVVSGGTEQLPMPMIFDEKTGSYVIAKEGDELKPGYETKTNYTSISIGIKAYNSDASSKNRIFGGINYIRYSRDYYQYLNYENIEILGGYRHTANNGIYISPYSGVRLLNDNNPICLGLNIGYQFKPIH